MKNKTRYQVTAGGVREFCAYGDDAYEVAKTLIKKARELDADTFNLNVGFPEDQYVGTIYITSGS